MTELATNTITADSRIGSHSASTAVMLTSYEESCESPFARGLRHRHKLFQRHARYHVAHRIQCQILRLLKANARLPHVELLPRRPKSILELGLERAAAVDRQQMQAQVVLLGRERR